jgi:hypothetical protein
MEFYGRDLSFAPSNILLGLVLKEPGPCRPPAEKRTFANFSVFQDGQRSEFVHTIMDYQRNGLTWVLPMHVPMGPVYLTLT